MRPISKVRVETDELRSPPAAMPAAPFSDIPWSIWIAFLSAWAMLFGLFLVFFATDGPAAMAVVTACFFAIMILGLPAMLCAQSRGPERPSDGRIKTHTGTVSVGAAATQILLIPIGSVIGLATLIILIR
jgi:hypothetical protein